MDSKFIDQEDSDINIEVISGEQSNQQNVNRFDVEDPPLLSSAPAPWWREKISANPKDWYDATIKEAKEFSWEITEPNHVVS
jgi:hypothetical protein